MRTGRVCPQEVIALEEEQPPTKGVTRGVVDADHHSTPTREGYVSYSCSYHLETAGVQRGEDSVGLT